MNDFDGLVALVTGGAGGIGAATAVSPASPRAGSTTGAVVRVDGGMTSLRV